MQNTNEVVIVNNDQVVVNPSQKGAMDNSYNNFEMGIGDLINHMRKIYFSSADRISRGEYFLASLPFTFLMLLALVGVLAIPSLFGFIGVLIIFSIISLILGIRLMIGRFHDLNMSGWYVLLYYVLSFIPFMFSSFGDTIVGIVSIITALVNLFFSIKLIFLKGTKGPNAYGQDPLLRQSSSDGNYRLLFLLSLALSLLSIFGGFIIVSKNFEALKIQGLSFAQKYIPNFENIMQ